MVERHRASTKQLAHRFPWPASRDGGDGGEYSSLQSGIYRHWVFEVCSKLISQKIKWVGYALVMKPWFLPPQRSLRTAPKPVLFATFADPKKPRRRY
jgi:hypothetical protein